MKKYTRTTIDIPQELYIRFKSKFLVPKQMTLKDFVISKMESELKKISE